MWEWTIDFSDYVRKKIRMVKGCEGLENSTLQKDFNLEKRE